MIVLLITMTAISASFRLFPFLLARWLRKISLLEKLESTFPLVISILLVAHLLEHVSFTHYPFGIAEIAGISGVIAAHCLFRKILLSMSIGVLIHQLLLYIFR